MHTIKTFEDACRKLNVDPTKLPDFSILPEKHAKALLAHTKLVLIAEALNDGWQPDWSNWNEYKYFPWMDIASDEENTSGSGLSFYVIAYTNSDSSVGSRLSYKSREIAKYAAEQFNELYKDYFLFTK